MDHLRAGLHEVGGAESVRVVLLRVAGRHHQVVRITGGGVPVEELLAGIAEGDPAVRVIITIPHWTGVLHVVLAVVIRLRVIEQRGGGELQDLALQCQRRSDGPAARLLLRVGTGVVPHQVVALDHGVQQADHELHGLIHAGTRHVVAVFGTGERPLDDRETAVETETDEIGACQQAARLVLHTLLFLGRDIGHLIEFLKQDVAVAHIFPDGFVQVRVDRSVVVAVVRRSHRTRIVRVVHDGIRKEELVRIRKGIRDTLPVVQALGRRVRGAGREGIVLHPVDVRQEPAGILSVREHRIRRNGATRGLLKESIAYLERIRAGIDAEAESHCRGDRYDGFIQMFHRS